MRGEILTYDDGPGLGLISGDDGARYSLARADLQQLVPLRAGMKVDFVAVEGRATEVITLAAQPVHAAYAGGAAAGPKASFDFKTLFLRADGRIGRKDYWIGVGILIAAQVVLGWIPLIGLIATIASLYFGICVSSKRLHDMGRSGWLAAVPYGLSVLVAVMSGFALIGGIMSASNGNGMGALAGFGGMAAITGLDLLLNLAFLIWLGVAESQPGDNVYGPPATSLANF